MTSITREKTSSSSSSSSYWPVYYFCSLKNVPFLDLFLIFSSARAGILSKFRKTDVMVGKSLWPG